MLRASCLALCVLLPLIVGCAAQSPRESVASRLTAELEMERTRSVGLQAENQRLTAALADEQARLKTLRADADKTASELADLKRKYEGRLSVVDELPSIPGVTVDRKGAIEVKGLSFKLGGAELTPESVETLKKVGTALAGQKGLVCVDGHTDNVPVERPETKKTFVDNLGLSLARAAAVARVLVEAKVPPERLIVRGFGETQPVASNDTEEGREKNRRVEIHLVPSAK